jgi:hypothetical protein
MTGGSLLCNNGKLLLLILLFLFLSLAFGRLNILSVDALVQTPQDWDCPQGTLPHAGIGHFQGLHPMRKPTTNHDYLTPVASPPGLSPGCLLHWSLVLDYCSRGFASWATSPLPWPSGLDTLVLLHSLLGWH